jgi:hypothetical protein
MRIGGSDVRRTNGLPLPSPTAGLRDDQEKNGGARGRTREGGSSESGDTPAGAGATPLANGCKETTQPPAWETGFLPLPEQAASLLLQHMPPVPPGHDADQPCVAGEPIPGPGSMAVRLPAGCAISPPS